MPRRGDSSPGERQRIVEAEAAVDRARLELRVVGVGNRQRDAAVRGLDVEPLAVPLRAAEHHGDAAVAGAARSPRPDRSASRTPPLVVSKRMVPATPAMVMPPLLALQVEIGAARHADAVADRPPFPRSGGPGPVALTWPPPARTCTWPASCFASRLVTGVGLDDGADEDVVAVPALDPDAAVLAGIDRQRPGGQPLLAHLAVPEAIVVRAVVVAHGSSPIALRAPAAAVRGPNLALREPTRTWRSTRASTRDCTRAACRSTDQARRSAACSHVTADALRHQRRALDDAIDARGRACRAGCDRCRGPLPTGTVRRRAPRPGRPGWRG